MNLTGTIRRPRCLFVGLLALAVSSPVQARSLGRLLDRFVGARFVGAKSAATAQKAADAIARKVYAKQWGLVQNDKAMAARQELVGNFVNLHTANPSHLLFLDGALEKAHARRYRYDPAKAERRTTVASLAAFSLGPISLGALGYHIGSTAAPLHPQMAGLMAAVVLGAYGLLGGIVPAAITGALLDGRYKRLAKRQRTYGTYHSPFVVAPATH